MFIFRIGAFSFSFFLFLSINISAGEVISYTPCSDSDEQICEIKEIRMPCKGANGVKKPCKFHTGSNVSMEFDFIPYFDSDALLTQAYSATLIDLPLPGMDRNGCKFTSCPLKSGEENTYHNAIYMMPGFPTLPYTVKWRLWDANKSTNGCCFTFKIRLLSQNSNN